jgi:hypothetical protein
MFVLKQKISGKLFQILLLLIIYEFSAAPKPTRGVRNLSLCALEVLVLVSETIFTKSVKYDGQF